MSKLQLKLSSFIFFIFVFNFTIGLNALFTIKYVHIPLNIIIMKNTMIDVV